VLMLFFKIMMFQPTWVILSFVACLRPRMPSSRPIALRDDAELRSR